jgi:hypothetical protein
MGSGQQPDTAHYAWNLVRGVCGSRDNFATTQLRTVRLWRSPSKLAWPKLHNLVAVLDAFVGMHLRLFNDSVGGSRMGKRDRHVFKRRLHAHREFDSYRYLADVLLPDTRADSDSHGIRSGSR